MPKPVKEFGDEFSKQSAQMIDLVMGRAWIFQAMTCRSKKEGKQTNGIQETENGPQKGLLLHKKQHQVH